MKVTLANPRGFCAGVDRAIEIVEKALDILGAPVYVRHEVVHNRFVVEGLRQRGAIFVDRLDEIPEGQTVVFSAHGVSRQVKKEAKSRNLRVFDATCPLVTKVHLEVARHARNGESVILIGHKGHTEVEGTMGQYQHKGAAEGEILLVETSEDVAKIDVLDPDKLAYVTQTTLSVDDTQDVIIALRERFPKIKGPKKDDICYATQNRQNAVKQLAKTCDVVLVVGSLNSSNSNRLRELAEKNGTRAYLIDRAADIKQSWIQPDISIGLTAGASAPEVLVKAVVARLVELGATDVIENKGIEENITFALPRNLRELKEGQAVEG